MRVSMQCVIAAALLFSSSARAAIELEQITPAKTVYVAGIDFDGPATFGPVNFDVTGILTALSVPDGLGGQELGLGCNASDFSGFTSGSIALVGRGNCNYTVKTQFAQDAGAIGVLIADYDDGSLMPPGGGSPTITIPAFRTSFALRPGFFVAALRGDSIFRMSTVPEGETWVLMLGGFGGVGLAIRRRNFKCSFASS